ncbi:MAG: phosphoribosylformylglycinamidine synthase subunit PurS [Pyrobaculum sp.]|jgi:phosphoribosylformylglycinamidine (FGAM) synthase PurS component
MKYAVYINVTYKASIREPEGETISKDLLKRLGYEIPVRAGKCLVLQIEASTPEEAREKAVKIAWDARLGNPNVHVVEVVKVEEL